MRDSNILLDTISSFFKVIEAILSQLISMLLTLIVLASIGAALFIFYRVAAHLITSSSTL